MQATITNFPYLREIWKKHAEEEALLGVSLTGIYDNKLMSGQEGKKKLAEVLNRLRESAVVVNKEFAQRLGIKQSAAISTGKPSGTVSALVGCASGIHPSFAKYYIRRVRADKKDPMAQMMVDAGFPYEDDAMKPEYQWVFSFPMKSPDSALVSSDINAMEHLEIWKIYQDHWTEHKPSITVTVKEHEWMDVGAWVWKHFDSVSGVAFLPYSGHIYKQMPFTECTKEEYEAELAKMPKDVDWSLLSKYEKEDKTTSSHELACSGGSCELVGLDGGKK
jgi:ribonucleoside-diphosphate reductase alpha chain